MEREFLIFKEVAFSKRENQKLWEDDQDKPQDVGKKDADAAHIASEKVV